MNLNDQDRFPHKPCEFQIRRFTTMPFAGLFEIVLVAAFDLVMWPIDGPFRLLFCQPNLHPAGAHQMSLAIASLLLISFPSSFDDGFKMSGPKQAMTIRQIISLAEKEDIQGGLRTKPKVFSAEYNPPGQRLFVAWYNPYSGRAACHFYLYRYDSKQKLWIRRAAQIIEGTPRLSLDLGDAITLRDFGGKAIKRFSIDD